MEQFEKKLKELVIYTLPKKCRKDKDIVDFYFRTYLMACKEYNKLKTK